MDIKNSIKIIINDINEIEKIVRKFENYSNVPRIEIDITLSKVRKLYDNLLLLRNACSEIQPEKKKISETDIPKEAPAEAHIEEIPSKSQKKDIEEFPGKGAIFYFLGAFLVVFIFPKDIAMASIMVLALGDSVSRLVGPYGYLKHPFTNTKFFEGVIAGTTAAFFGALFFVPWILAFIGSLVSMLLEGLDLRIRGFKIDDNLLIPIVAAVVMQSIKVLL